MNRRTVDLLISVGIRAAVGVVAGVVLALGGWFIAWFFFLRSGASLTEAMVVFSISTGFFGGVGAGLAWLRLDDGVRTNAPVVLLAIVGGLVGAVAGLVYAREVFNVVVTKGEGDITAIAAAGIAANLLPLIWYIVDGLRKPTAPGAEPYALPKRDKARGSR